VPRRRRCSPAVLGSPELAAVENVGRAPPAPRRSEGVVWVRFFANPDTDLVGEVGEVLAVLPLFRYRAEPFAEEPVTKPARGSEKGVPPLRRVAQPVVSADETADVSCVALPLAPSRDFAEVPTSP